MKIKTFISLSLAVISMMTYGQRPVIELSFQAVNNTSWIQLDSLRVVNQTEGGEIVLYYPDTVLELEYTGILQPDEQGTNFAVFQNYPNPVSNQTTLSLFLPENGRIELCILDISGRTIINRDVKLDKGLHTFLFIPGSCGIYIFNARWRGENRSIKIINSKSGQCGASSLKYEGKDISDPQLKVTEKARDFIFNLGDQLLLVGYHGTLESGILDSPDTNRSYIFQFATNIPCPGTPTVDYEGQVYNTIQIFSQCWLKENLNVGWIVPGNEWMNDNDTIEKYCYNNNLDSCDKYGGLYLWDEMMQYNTLEGIQGICPDGWHIPTDNDWKVLGGAVDSQYGIGDNTWNTLGFCGYDAGINLKSTFGWEGSGNGTDAFGFRGLPAGNRTNLGNFYNISQIGDFWSSTFYSDNMAWGRELSATAAESYRYYYNKQLGLSVRCLRDTE